MSARLNQLILSNIRNLSSQDLSFGPKFNVFIGPNGSGKTSLLEAIHLLSIGRSFRARSMRQIISFGTEQCLIRGLIGAASESSSETTENQNSIWMAVERSLAGETQYKIGGQSETSAAELTKMLPVQLIDVNSHLLLEGGPNYRRQFMDWGVFHVEHSFLQHWRLMQRALEQRNAALKQRLLPATTWDEAFIKYAMLVDVARRAYLERFQAIFLTMVAEMLHLNNVVMRYKRGWTDDIELATAIQSSLNQDLAYGYTTRGPQRADLEITIDGKVAKDVLSRGQIKIFVCIMLLARAKLLNEVRASVFLIDDLHAELDKQSCSLFVDAIKATGCQVFITGIDSDVLRDRLQGCEMKLFHVEQGRIT